ncbi:ATP-grasp domain-containing protein [Aquibacillus salsiterrae]|uniref:RimK family alpha-L-glutamate ligase n=1 Tax=Aquibacillus salsiterrae TaxID=2950439 RepID=A0A9X3WB18_9BACI|nr:RimK family alpha-L-glutamate ligase [Aquibacillus salsiterrae]MDC3415677.1 RimK family alpha-L-glutamate ligase [Aquibacillus salsiterrae]
MIGWIIYNGHLPSKKFINFANWIKDAGLNKGIQMETVKNNHVWVELGTNISGVINDKHLSTPNFVIFHDKDIALARQLEQSNIPVINSAAAIEICDNKITTYQQLTKDSIPIPKTFVAPKIFEKTEKVELDSFLIIENYLSYPFIIKEAYGSFGEQVYLIETRQQYVDKINELKGVPFVIQQFVATSYGKDIRINVIGGKVVASMLRKGNGDFRANVNAGGSTEPYSPSPKEKALAIAAAASVGADFAGVDLLFGENGNPIVCEVNSNAHIQGIYESTGINVADYMIDYCIEKVKGMKDL